MPTVLLTRPQASSELLAIELKRQGYATFIEPLLSIVPTFASPPHDKNFDAIVLTSANALTALENAKQDIAHLLPLSCFCVGTHTATQARGFGFRNVHDAEGDGAALTRLIGDYEHKSLLHIAGSDVNPTAQDELRSAGFSVTPWVVYTAEASKHLSATALAALKGGKFDAALLFSPRTGEIFNGLLMKHALEACCASVIAIGISEASLTALRPLSWRRLDAAAKPTEDAVIEKLQTLLPVSRT